MWKQLLKLWHEDNLLEQAWQMSYEMVEICQEMFKESIKALREEGHDNIDKEIREKDKIINKYEREVRRKILTHLAVKGAHEVPAGLILVTVIIDIERVGDFTKNIVELVEAHGKTLKAGKYEKSLKKIEQGLFEVFEKTKFCIRESNPEAALEIMDGYNWIAVDCEKNLRKIIKQKDRKIDSGTAATLALYFRYLKRIYAHLRNLTSSVVNPFDRIGFKPKAKDVQL
jgi:phosphate transport system protein